jgi:hypothetical protein
MLRRLGSELMMAPVKNRWLEELQKRPLLQRRHSRTAVAENLAYLANMVPRWWTVVESGDSCASRQAASSISSSHDEILI